MRQITFFFTAFTALFPLAAQTLAKEKVMVDSLSSTAFYGRGYEFNGHTKAAAYIADVWAENGIKPFSETYFDHFSFETTLFETAPTLVLNSDTLALSADYLPHPATASGNFSTFGKNIIDLANRIFIPQKAPNWPVASLPNSVVIINADVKPPKEAAKSERPFYSLYARLLLLKRLGVSGVLVRSRHLMYTKPQFQAGVPVFSVLEKHLSQIESISANIAVARKQVTTPNVVGIVPETAQNDSILLLTAHYDHLGAIGKEAIFFGANDNASGVAMITGLATKLRSSRYKVMLVAFSGEESGLLGSKHFVENNIIDIDKIAFILNLDMVASAKDGIVAMGGVEFSAAYAALGRHAQAEDFPISRRKNKAISDHFHFLSRGVRGFFVYTKNGDQPYHKTEDVSLTLDYEVYSKTRTILRHFLEEL